MAAPAIDHKVFPGSIARQPPLVWYIALVLAILALLAPTTRTLFGTWLSSANYIHGFGAFLLWLGLVWTRRRGLHFAEAPPAPVVGLVTSACLTFWLIAYSSEINFLAQIALVFTVIAAFWGLFGLGALKAFAPPLGLLLFAVPLGDSLLPPLQQATAWIAQSLLGFAGMPYAYEHPYFTTSAARFHISEACAGMNFVSMSALAAYLLAMKYRLSLARALFLLAGGAILALLINGVRAFSVIAGVTMFPDSTLGADHLWIGLLLFAPALLLLFLVATRLARKTMTAQLASERPPSARPPIQNFVAILALLSFYSVVALLFDAS